MAWEERNKITYQPLSSLEILEEIKRVLAFQKNKDNDCISLYDVAKLMKTKDSEYKRALSSFQEHFLEIVEFEFGSRGSIIVYDFDYDKNELRIGFRHWDDYDKITFSKKDDDLYIKESESYDANKILVVLGNDLSKLYDKLIGYSEFKKQKHSEFKSSNSNFQIEIGRYDVGFFSSSQSNRYLKDFEISSYNFKEEYDYKCNSNNIASVFRGKEDELFKRIFVRIDDCPEWSQSILYEIRQNQLAKEIRIEEERQQKEAKKQKRLELIKTIFPFL